MNTKRLAPLSKVLTILAVLAMVFGLATPAFAQNPDPWAPFCSGSGALVIQEESNTGDGVSMSAEDAVANWQCGNPNVLVGYIEPWDGNNDRNTVAFPDKFNPESMVVGTPKQLLAFVQRTGLGNGSWWIVDGRYASHPLVVYADKATNADNLGLNPMENQIDLDRMGWVRGRMEELFGVQKYVDEFYSTDLLAQRVVQLGWASAPSAATPTAVAPATTPTDPAVAASPVPTATPGANNVPPFVESNEATLFYIGLFCLISLLVLGLLVFAGIRAFRKPKSE